MELNAVSGLHYLGRGFSRLKEPGLRRYVVVPIVFNALLMSLASWWAVSWLNTNLTEFSEWLPTWLSWLYWLLMPIAVFLVLMIVAYFFSTVLVILMAPFSGLLSERIEQQVGVTLPSESLWSMTKRTIWRELLKLAYFLPRYLLLALLGFVPIVNVLAPLLWGVFVSWSLALQYCDYSFDNRQLNFKQTRQAVRGQGLRALGFGGGIMVLMSIPIINWFVVPAAVIGATEMNLQQKLIPNA